MEFKNNTARVIYVSCVTAFLTALSCWAVLAHQGTVLAMRGGGQSSASNDIRFARDAARGGVAEIKLGDLAQSKASSDTVKAFAGRMIAEHTTSGDHLKQAASSENITLPEQLSAKDQSTFDALSKLSGADFDRAYAQDMVRDHQADLAAFQKEANSGKDEALRDFASQTIPMIQEHLNQAKEMLKTVVPTASNRSKSGAARQGRR
jgi:putative membrane protein